MLGSLNMDLVVTVPHLPRPGETVLGEGLGRFPGGKGGFGPGKGGFGGFGKKKDGDKE